MTFTDAGVFPERDTVQFSDMSWDTRSFLRALDVFAATENAGPLAALFNDEGSINVSSTGGGLIDMSVFRLGFTVGEPTTPSTFSTPLSDLIKVPFTIEGSAGSDRLIGGIGSDAILVGSGNFDDTGNFARVYGTLGNDVYDLSNQRAEDYVFFDYAEMSSGSNNVIANFTGATGTVVSNGSFDTVMDYRSAGVGFGVGGGAGDDRFEVRPVNGQIALIAGLSGFDTYALDVSDGIAFLIFDGGGIMSGIDADLATGVISNDSFGTQDSFTLVGPVSSESFRVRGTNQGDRILARFEGSTIVGLDGNDTITGRSGDDDLFGSQGDDSILGGGGEDSISGGAGADTLRPGDGDDLVNAGDGNDLMADQGAGNDTLNGDDGDDDIIAGGGNDVANGGDGADSILGGFGFDTLSGGDGR
ncbi:MAG: calcium-binding protein, partial [Sphaerospermopsis sp. SIO1G2]|nr:calcium-binding protein [Sphaerospermopsis sp. SIO1G2]